MRARPHVQHGRHELAPLGQGVGDLLAQGVDTAHPFVRHDVILPHGDEGSARLEDPAVVLGDEGGGGGRLEDGKGEVGLRDRWVRSATAGDDEERRMVSYGSVEDAEGEQEEAVLRASEDQGRISRSDDDLLRDCTEVKSLLSMCAADFDGKHLRVMASWRDGAK